MVIVLGRARRQRSSAAPGSWSDKSRDGWRAPRDHVGTSSSGGGVGCRHDRAEEEVVEVHELQDPFDGF
jgi:hypothetical protein